MLDKCNNYLCRAGQTLIILTHDSLWHTPPFGETARMPFL